MSESGPTVSTNSGGDGGGHKKGGRGDGPPKKKFPPKENKASTEHPPVEHNQQGERPEGKGGRGGGAGRGSGGRGPPKFLKKQDPATEGNEEAAPNTDKDSHPKAKKANQFPKKDSPAPHTTKKEATNTDAKKDTDNTPKRTSHKLIIRKLPPSKDFRKDEFQNCIHKVIEQLTSMTGKQIEQDLIKVEHFIEGKISRKRGPIFSAGFINIQDDDLFHIFVSQCPSQIPFLSTEHDVVNAQPEITVAPYNKVMRDKKPDKLVNTFEQDPEFLKFKEQHDKPNTKLASADVQLDQRKAAMVAQGITATTNMEAKLKNNSLLQFLREKAEKKFGLKKLLKNSSFVGLSSREKKKLQKKEKLKEKLLKKEKKGKDKIYNPSSLGGDALAAEEKLKKKISRKERKEKKLTKLMEQGVLNPEEFKRALKKEKEKEKRQKKKLEKKEAAAAALSASGSGQGQNPFEGKKVMILKKDNTVAGPPSSSGGGEHNGDAAKVRPSKEYKDKKVHEGLPPSGGGGKKEKRMKPEQEGSTEGAGGGEGAKPFLRGGRGGAGRGGGGGRGGGEHKDKPPSGPPGGGMKLMKRDGPFPPPPPPGNN